MCQNCLDNLTKCSQTRGHPPLLSPMATSLWHVGQGCSLLMFALANDTAVVVVSLRRRAAQSAPQAPPGKGLDRELRPDIGCLQGCREPAGKLEAVSLTVFRRCDDSKPVVQFEILKAPLSEVGTKRGSARCQMEKVPQRSFIAMPL